MSSFVGIDISARKFDLVIREAGRNLTAEQFLQTTDGHAQAIKQLLLIRPQIIVMEATGIDYLDLAWRWSRPVCLLPLLIPRVHVTLLSLC